MGANQTSNQLHSAHGGYERICEAFDLQCTNWNMLRMLENEIERGQKPGDWLDAIVVALDTLNRHSAKKIKTYKIVLITTFESRVDAECYATVVQQLQSMQIDLIVMYVCDCFGPSQHNAEFNLSVFMATAPTNITTTVRRRNCV